MTPDQKTIIRQNWTQVAPIADRAAELFYARLFEIEPSVRPLFKSVDMAVQGAKLMDIIGVVVSSLDRLDTLLPVVESLGRRHVAYGVEDAHFDAVGAALLWTLEQGLGPTWTAEAADAWGTAYAVLSGVMRSAAQAEKLRAA